MVTADILTSLRCRDALKSIFTQCTRFRQEAFISHSWVAVLQVNGAAMLKALLFQHPPHDHISPVGINPKGTSSQLHSTVRSVRHHPPRQPLSPFGNCHRHPVNGNVIFLIGKPLPLSDAIITGFLRHQNKSSPNPTVW